MEQAPKSKTGLILTLALIIGLLVGGAGVFFWKDGEVSNIKKDLETKDQKITTLEKEVASLPKGIELDDKQTLQIMTTEQVADSDVADYWLPIVHNVYEDYASTSPLPIVYTVERGYEVPGMGGMNYFWHKENGAWKKIGTCSESGCDMADGYSYEKLPKELTH